MLNQNNQYLTVEARTETRTAMGMSNVWNTVLKCWGRVHPYRSREVVEASSNRAEVTHVIYLRYENAVRYGSHRIRLVTRIFEITDPPVTVSGETKCFCREVLV
jgi:SPP1 family predicted phage head-tail adaptor